MHKHPTVKPPVSVSIGLLGFIMITSAALLSIRTFPVVGLLGRQSVTFNIAAIGMYLLPAAFVAAELASGAATTRRFRGRQLQFLGPVRPDHDGVHPSPRSSNAS